MNGLTVKPGDIVEVLVQGADQAARATVLELDDQETLPALRAFTAFVERWALVIRVRIVDGDFKLVDRAGSATAAAERVLEAKIRLKQASVAHEGGAE